MRIIYDWITDKIQIEMEKNDEKKISSKSQK